MGTTASSVLEDLKIDMNPLPEVLKAEISAALLQSSNPHVNYKDKEVKGIHPSHHVLVQCMVDHITSAGGVNRKCYYNWNMNNQTSVNAKIQSNRPDIFCGTSNDCADISFVLEIKPRKELEKGVKQAATYALEILQNNIEYSRHVVNQYCCYFFASNGMVLSVGKAVIDATDDVDPVTCTGSVETDVCLPLTAVNAQGKAIRIRKGEYAIDLDSPGVRALYAVLQLTQEQLGFVGRRHSVEFLAQNLSFRVTAILGSGSFSTVYRAVPSDGAHEVAIKTCHYLPRTWETSEASFEEEYNVLSKIQDLNNVNLPRLYYVQQDASATRRMIVFDGVDLSLSEYLRGLTKPQRRKFALKMKPQLESAVEAVNGLPERYCHTDIRPFNITVRDDVPVLIDWGLASAEGTVVRIGTRRDINYMPGEVVQKIMSKQDFSVCLDHDYYAICCVVAACVKFFSPEHEFSRVTWSRKGPHKMDAIIKEIFTSLKIKPKKED